ncbi:hypothetical protein TraAM80_03351 [Trypanosoma rangeli]|uniref:Uncharacterized protein n=1 Tax=Trypanosoma rangeli TaxID=5698 RepID=A0A3R7M1V0_TRYRA|nr:uncharacterized protein TraAM80_03351 [Trypanosoma rangeli]RNF07495.1 hypothetical protein TraAM80_03351 [Trypanosoma rangeli]|eukprot:RNF07495.1 hypothetical protein TraAM80_03351 [Trypanosoma rangeli]
MMYPKLLASQELSLRRITVQQHCLSMQLLDPDTNSMNPSVNSPNTSVSSTSLPRQVSARSELTSPLTLSSAGQVGASFPPTKTVASSLTPIAGYGTNSTAPASIARPSIRVRSEWSSALEDIGLFVFPARQLHGSQPSTRRHVTVRYVADQYDHQWIAQRQASSNSVLTKGKTGGIGHSATTSLSPSPRASASASSERQKISLSILEDLITAFEVGSYCNPEIPVQRQPVSSFNGVIATGADTSVVEEVRQYWLGKRQALGGNVPCIPSLHMNVQEDNQTSLCHKELLQFCPLPFNHRDWSTTVLQRRIPRSINVKKMTETNTEVVKTQETGLLGRKRPRLDADKAASRETVGPTTEEEDAAAKKERHALLSAGLKVARAVLEREEIKLTHTHLALYELALLRQAAMEGCDFLEGGASSPFHAPWASDEALQEDWETGGCDVVGSGIAAAVVESVMAIGRGLC